MKNCFFLVDVNSAFLSWEATYRIKELGESLDLRLIPSVVGGDIEKRHGIVLAKSVLTKKYHIQTGEPIVSACAKCPGLMVVPPNFSIYLAASRAFIAILKRYAVEVWQYSIDEAFCDFSGTELIYGDPIVFANELKDIIYEELGFTVNIGVGNNKLLAKMASDFQKPNKVNTLFSDEVEKKMWPLPVSDLFFVGRATSLHLEKLGIKTIGDLAHTEDAILKSHFKSQGCVIKRYANGGDLEFVFTNETQNKGYGNSTTLAKDVEDVSTAHLIMLSLCETIASRVRKDNAYIRVVSISIVYADFTRVAKQITLPSATDSTLEIHTNACALFSQIWNHLPIRQLGVSTSKATEERLLQYNLFDMDRYERYSKADAAIDKIRNTYGNDAILRASFLKDSNKHMRGGNSNFGKHS